MSEKSKKPLPERANETLKESQESYRRYLDETFPNRPIASWENVRKIESNLGRYIEQNPLGAGSRFLFDSKSVDRSKYSKLQIDAIEYLFDSPLEAFTYYISVGEVPPLEILLAIDEALYAYEVASGEFELEELFFGKSSSHGNYSARKNRKHYHLYFLLDEKINAPENSGKSISEIAEEILDSMGRAVDQSMDQEDRESRKLAFSEFGKEIHSLPDLDTFLRGYRRYKIKYK